MCDRAIATHLGTARPCSTSAAFPRPRCVSTARPRGLRPQPAKARERGVWRAHGQHRAERRVHVPRTRPAAAHGQGQQNPAAPDFVALPDAVFSGQWCLAVAAAEWLSNRFTSRSSSASRPEPCQQSAYSASRRAGARQPDPRQLTPDHVQEPRPSAAVARLERSSERLRARRFWVIEGDHARLVTI